MYLLLLRHNDIHYARACQVFSIESKKKIMNRYVDRFFTLWFSTKRLQMTTHTIDGKRQAAPPFPFTNLLIFALFAQINRTIASMTQNHVFIDSQISIVAGVESSVHHRMNCCFAAQKWKWEKERKKKKLNLLTIIFHYINIYWFRLVVEIEMHQSFRRSKRLSLPSQKELMINAAKAWGIFWSIELKKKFQRQ